MTHQGFFLTSVPQPLPGAIDASVAVVSAPESISSAHINHHSSGGCVHGFSPCLLPSSLPIVAMSSLVSRVGHGE